jgi:hypothetical protein
VNSSLLSDGTFCHYRTDLQVQESTSSSSVGEKLLGFQYHGAAFFFWFFMQSLDYCLNQYHSPCVESPSSEESGGMIIKLLQYDMSRRSAKFARSGSCDSESAILQISSE